MFLTLYKAEKDNYHTKLSENKYNYKQIFRISIVFWAEMKIFFYPLVNQTKIW